MDQEYAVIMAGGGGTRLWPLSRRGRPKQSLTLFGERSLFQIAVERIQPLVPVERIRVVTVEEQLAVLRRQVEALPPTSFVLEPAPKGTAAVIGLAATALQAQDAEAVMCVLTADHYIREEERFRSLMAAALEQARQGDLVTLGIEPTMASTGYGYLEVGPRLGEASGVAVHRVESFREKPNQETATAYFESGNYLWNSGMFVWRADRILEAMAQHMPDLALGLDRIAEALGSDRERAVIEEVWERLQPETIDYGVMEKADDVVVLPAEDLGWWDVGSWNRLFDLLETDSEGNLVKAGRALLVETSGTLVLQDPDLGPSDTADRLIATLGVEDLVIVDTGRALLVASRQDAERVRSLVDQLEERGLERYL